ncbi:hypothetical protein DYBT9623_00009 [Dyadobacter sp. CECT 9623]|uniref:CopG family transcriptional regulator n=2 Tax=Dyadobacter linearis TaxID=2823330 RepID=A0ABM8UII3_9BACT|nr:hypothetical protein DYBT9623_00009 [Dyadobacter sp. CECT 9623]
MTIGLLKHLEPYQQKNQPKYLSMRTLSISISDNEYSKFGLKEESLSFADFLELVSKELTRQNLNKSVALAEKYGISAMSMEEITDEVKAVRNAKNRH